MTLIIGFRCSQGVALVSDTKVLDLSTGEHDYTHKILTPLSNPFIVGAAGYSDLFKQFNREIPLVVARRLNEFRISNISWLMRSGLSRDEAIQSLNETETARVEEKQQQAIRANEKKAHSKVKKITPIPLPNTYSYQYFINDCKDVINQISEQARHEVPNPIDILIGLLGPYPYPSLHYIDCVGHEREIEDYYAIGSGSPHVKQFFSLLYNFNKDLLELISYAFYAIAYVTHVEKDNGVGYDEAHPPEAVVVYNNGTYGRIRFENEMQYFLGLEQEMEIKKDIIKKINISKLKQV